MRLIDADALKKEVDNFQNCYNGWSDTYDKSFIIGAIEEQPSIEAIPVRRGKWNVVYDKNGCHNVCPFCGDWKYYVNQNFCGECGADMRGENDETYNDKPE